MQDPQTDGAMFVPIILSSDKTTVSVATGQNDYWPVYLSIGNVHNNVWHAHRNAIVLLGFLLLRPVLLTGRDKEQRWFGGRRDLDYSAPRVRWLRTPLRGEAEAQGTRPSKPEKKGTHLIRNSRGIAVRVGQLLSGLGKVLDTFLCPLHESGLVEGGRM